MPASRVNDPRTQGAALLASYPPRHRPGFDERLAASSGPLTYDAFVDVYNALVDLAQRRGFIYAVSEASP